MKEFTGISSPYEVPQSPEVTVKTGELPLADCVTQVLALLLNRGVVRGSILP